MAILNKIVIGLTVASLVIFCNAAPARGELFNVIHDFNSPTDNGKTPYGSLTLSGNYLYGMTSGDNADYGTIFKINISDPNDYSILHHFSDGSVMNDGKTPYGNLTLSGGYLYGMTSAGGAYLDAGTSCGTVFKMNVSNPSDYIILHNFGDPDVPVPGDGIQPWGSLTLAGGMLYGMTNQGGTGYGTFFKIDTAVGLGYSVIHHFGSDLADAATPYYSNLTLDPATGTLYGMTGSSADYPSHYGTIFKYETVTEAYSILYQFTGLTDGNGPYGSLTLVDGDLYGMTVSGGDYLPSGAIFKYDLDAPPETALENLYSFSDSTGSNPRGSLTYAGNGVFYGMTQFGGYDELGNYDDVGTIFKLDTTKDKLDPDYFQVLWGFDSAGPCIPYGDLTLVNGVLYGMTPVGSSPGNSYDGGVIFAYGQAGPGPVGDVPEPSTLLLLLPFIGVGLRKLQAKKV